MPNNANTSLFQRLLLFAAVSSFPGLRVEQGGERFPWTAWRRVEVERPSVEQVRPGPTGALPRREDSRHARFYGIAAPSL